MPHFVTLLKYTQHGITNVKESPKRLDTYKKEVESLGGKVHGWYSIMGRYDALLIAEFPDDKTCAQYMLSVAARGATTTETFKAFTETEYRDIINRIS